MIEELRIAFIGTVVKEAHLTHLIGRIWRLDSSMGDWNRGGRHVHLIGNLYWEKR